METQKIEFSCSDDCLLAGTLFIPKGEVKAAVMIGPATGIKQTFYYNFANFLCENGFGVLTFDNRGIGASKRGSINNMNPTLVDWGKLDMTAALEQLKAAFPDKNYHLVGHSAGGQLVGLMENALDLKSMFNYACSSGSLRNSPYPFKIKSYLFLNILIPISNVLFGHMKSQWVGMGEPLPKGVAAQWRKWCNGSGYVAVELGKTIHEHYYNKLEIPSIWFWATDDDIANLDNVKDMIRVYSKMPAEIVALDPKKLGFKDIGHMKFFSSRRKSLWTNALDWLNKN